MFSTSEIQISKSALINNIQFIREQLSPEVRVSYVIKGNAYGHGIETFLPLAESCGVKNFAVFNANEAHKAWKVKSDESSLLIMGMIENGVVEWAVKNEIDFYVFELERLHAAINASKKTGKKARVHIEVETGMNRTGFTEMELSKAIKIIEDNLAYLSLEGFCTHYAGAESVGNYLRIHRQIKNYKRLYRLFQKAGLEVRYRHTASSAATMAYPNTILDMVRIGILQYGFWPSKEIWMNYLQNQELEEDKNPLKRVINWKSKVMSVKKIKAGEFVGYGTTFLTSKEITMATVPVGYADGYARSLSNMGRVLIGGKRLSVIGIVNMNMLMVDASEVPDVKKGDEVVMIGKQGGLSITVESFGELSSQLNYELLTRLPSDIPRKVIE